MDVKVVFGENLKLYRKQKKMSQEQLSEKVNISAKHLSSIERGLNFVSSDLLERLAVSVDVPVFYLFVDDKKVIHNDIMLDGIDRLIEKNLLKAIKEIKADIRQSNQ